jgi:hypothetical protein
MSVLQWIWEWIFLWLLCGLWKNVIATPLFSGAVVAFVLWWRTRPAKLLLTLEEPEHGKTIAGQRVYRHLVVKNTGHAPAHNVRVYLKRVAVKGDEEHPLHSNDIPMFFQWERNLERKNLLATRERTVGAPMKWDLCSIAQGEQTIKVEVIDAACNWNPELAQRKTYLLTFEATSNEVSSAQKTVSIFWDGEWDDDTRICAEKHLIVAEV